MYSIFLIHAWCSIESVPIAQHFHIDHTSQQNVGSIITLSSKIWKQKLFHHQNWCLANIPQRLCSLSRSDDINQLMNLLLRAGLILPYLHGDIFSVLISWQSSVMDAESSDYQLHIYRDLNKTFFTNDLDCLDCENCSICWPILIFHWSCFI